MKLFWLVFFHPHDDIDQHVTLNQAARELALLSHLISYSPQDTQLQEHLLQGSSICWGSPDGAVSLALWAIMKVKRDRARWVRGWVTRWLTVSNWTLVVGWPASFLACACSVNIVDSLQHVQLIGCGNQRAGVQTVRQNITKLSATKTLCCHWRALKAMYGIDTALSSRR